MNVTAPATIALAGTWLAALTDLRTGSIPDPLSLTTLGLVLLAALPDGTFGAAVIGACVASAALGTLYVVTARRGIGLGDVKLAAAIGAGLGTLGALAALAVAFVAGAACGLVLLATRRATRRTALPFAPFLALGTFVVALRPPS